MFVVETEVFQPLESNPEVKIKILQPSFPIKMKAKAALGMMNAQGPLNLDFAKIHAHDDILFKHCVKSCEGISVDGVELKTAEELWENGPSEIIQLIINKIGGMTAIGEDLKKK